MHLFAPELLAAWTGGRWSKLPGCAISGFATDTRQLAPGQAFVALRTEKRDGHEFLAAAEAAGASAAIVLRHDPALALPQLIVGDPLAAFQRIAREHRHRFGGRVIGISGSCGKTSTKDLIALLLGGEQGGAMATEGNLNNQLGVPLTLTRIDPESHRFAVIEAGISAPGEMDALARMIEPDLALITLVGPAHLMELGGLEGVAREKSRLAAATRAAGLAIFPRQCDAFSPFRDLAVRRMIIEPAEVLRPAEPPKDTVYFTVTQRGETTAIALAYGRPPPLVFTMKRVSEGMAQNAVLAICAAL
ncbi:MAG: Mur ligase family protein, partial [Opitutaceae bacterium]